MNVDRVQVVSDSRLGSAFHLVSHILRNISSPNLPSLQNHVNPKASDSPKKATLLISLPRHWPAQPGKVSLKMLTLPLALIQQHRTLTSLRGILHSKDDDGIWYIETSLPLEDPQNNSFWAWNMPPKRIDTASAYPRFDGRSMTRFIDIGPRRSDYEKKVDLLQSPDLLFTRPGLADITLREM
jgi:hypothetical protein